MNCWQFLEISDLPKTVQELAKIIGTESVFALLKTCRGKRVYIPKNLKNGHQIVELVGLEASGKLVYEFGGLWLQLPRCKAALLKAQIRCSRASGEKISHIARSNDVSASRVWQILAAA